MNRPIHFEILTDEPEKAASFYESVFGWKVSAWGGAEPYWLVTTGSDDQQGIDGGMMHRHFSQAVINTVDVESIHEAISKVKNSGGKLVHGPSEIPGVGMHAYCEDSQGVMFGMLQPADAE